MAFTETELNYFMDVMGGTEILHLCAASLIILQIPYHLGVEGVGDGDGGDNTTGFGVGFDANDIFSRDSGDEDDLDQMETASGIAAVEQLLRLIGNSTIYPRRWLVTVLQIDKVKPMIDLLA